MKKLVFLFFCLIVFIFAFSGNSTIYSLCASFESGVVSFYCGNVDNLALQNSELNVIKNGNQYILSSTSANARLCFDLASEISGFSLRVNAKNPEIKNIISQIKVVKSENLENITCVYGYLTGLPFCKIIDGKKVNIQIAIRDNVATIGSPIILGSY